MAKKTWVNIGGAWRNVKTAWLNIAGTWTKIIPKGNVAGVWKDFMQYMLKVYETGIEHIPIVKYASSGTSTFEKNTDHILADSYSSYSTGYILYGSDILINLSGITTLYIDWVSDNSNYRELRFSICDTKTGASLAEFYKLNDTTRKTDTLDVSAFSGDFYIRVRQYAKTTSINKLSVFNIWGE